MPFNPDEYLAKKQAETATPSAGAQQAFDPNSYLQSKGVQTLPNGGTPQTPVSAAQAYEQSNPPTPLSAAVLGAEQGATYNFAKKAAGTVDAESAAAYDVNREKYPITFGLGQLAGAIATPNPFGKIGAIKNAAGVLPKMGAAAAQFFGGLGLASFGASEAPTLQGKLKDVADTTKSPLALTLGGLALISPAVPEILRRGSDYIVKDGKSAVALGKGMQDLLKTDAGQQTVARAAGTFADSTAQAANQSFDHIGPIADAVAAANKGIPVNLQSAFDKVYKTTLGVKSDEVSPLALPAYNKLNNWLTSAENAFIKTSQDGQATTPEFATAYDKLKELGQEVFQKGAYNNTPEVKRAAQQLYFDISNVLGKADKSGDFAKVREAFKGLFAIKDASESLGSALGSVNPLAIAPTLKRDELIKAYEAIPGEFKAKLPELGDLIGKQMDDVMTAYRVASKIAGKSPTNSILSTFMSKLPMLNGGSRLNVLNRLGAEAAGRATPLIENALGPNVLRGLSAPILTPTQPSEQQGALAPLK